MGDEVSLASVPRPPLGHLHLGNSLFPLLFEIRFLASEQWVTDRSWLQIRHSGLFHSQKIHWLLPCSIFVCAFGIGFKTRFRNKRSWAPSQMDEEYRISELRTINLLAEFQNMERLAFTLGQRRIVDEEEIQEMLLIRRQHFADYVGNLGRSAHLSKSLNVGINILAVFCLLAAMSLVPLGMEKCAPHWAKAFILIMGWCS